MSWTDEQKMRYLFTLRSKGVTDKRVLTAMEIAQVAEVYIRRRAVRHLEKGRPDLDMLVVKIGGPAYRIGMGGGAASSMVQGENVEELDFNAVQRGDAEMEQKVNRVIRACVEMGDINPIVSIHDQGAGGLGGWLAGYCLKCAEV